MAEAMRGGPRRPVTTWIEPWQQLALMTRAGLEPATYGLQERLLLSVLAPSSIAKLLGERFFRARR